MNSLAGMYWFFGDEIEFIWVWGEFGGEVDIVL